MKLPSKGKKALRTLDTKRFDSAFKRVKLKLSDKIYFNWKLILSPSNDKKVFYVTNVWKELFVHYLLPTQKAGRKLMAPTRD